LEIRCGPPPSMPRKQVEFSAARLKPLKSVGDLTCYGPIVASFGARPDEQAKIGFEAAFQVQTQ
jgi:hypothetical protein